MRRERRGQRGHPTVDDLQTMSTEQETADSKPERYQYIDNPHRDAQVLEKLYVERGLTMEEIADLLDVSPPTVLYWLREYDIPTREQKRRRVKRATYRWNSGRPQWTAADPDGSTNSVAVSQLTAIADGADPHRVFDDDYHVHHRNGHPFDNRPRNLEVVEREHHRAVHRGSGWDFDVFLGCRIHG